MAFRLGILTDVQYADKPAVPHPRFRGATAAAAAAAAAADLPPPPPAAVRDYRDALRRLHAAMDDLVGGGGDHEGGSPAGGGVGGGGGRDPAPTLTPAPAPAAVVGATLGAVLHLGDLIDGRVLAHDDGAMAADAAGRPPSRASAMAANREDLGAVLAAFRRFTAGPVLHVVGNHCLFAGRLAVLAAAGVPEGDRPGDAWYTYVPLPVGAGKTRGGGAGGVGVDSDGGGSGGGGGNGGGGGRPWRIVVLDTMAIGVAYPPGDARRVAAEAHLAAVAGAPNAVEWVGALGPAQRVWLAGVCAAARAAGEQLLVCGHHPLDPAVATPAHPAWDGPAVAALLDEYADVVRAYFCGHHHPGGYRRRPSGVHHVNFVAVLDAVTPDGLPANAYAVAALHPHAIAIEGRGVQPSYRLTWGRCL